jgi:hypothetical protein
VEALRDDCPLELDGLPDRVGGVLVVPARPPRRGPPRIVTNAGLLLLAVGMFASAFAPFVRGESPTWWALLARTGAACVGGVMYEQRFGVRAQAFALAMHFIRWPARLRAAIARIRSGVHLVRQ